MRRLVSFGFTREDILSMTIPERNYHMVRIKEEEEERARSMGILSN